MTLSGVDDRVKFPSVPTTAAGTADATSSRPTKATPLELRPARALKAGMVLTVQNLSVKTLATATVYVSLAPAHASLDTRENPVVRKRTTFTVNALTSVRNTVPLTASLCLIWATGLWVRSALWDAANSAFPDVSKALSMSPMILAIVILHGARS